MQQVLVYSDSLSWGEDPFKPGRNGLTGLQQRIEVNSPLCLVILMLGTNDFQSMHDFNADADQHLVLAHALAQEVASLLDKPAESAR
jgi:lysophospholipase L1-like esterase